jgi:hypothetical protein
MQITNDTLLLKINEASAYYDKFSLEKSTGRIKPKYKLMRSSILEQYFFNVLTTDRTACKKTLTIKIEKDDWLNRVKGYLEERSFCDLTKFDIIDEKVLLKKIRDKRNHFLFVGELCEKKYNKLKKLSKKVKYLTAISRETKDIVENSLIGIFDKRIKELGIN